MSTAVSGRVVCPRCKANNFDTQAACWKCSAPLQGGGAELDVPRPVSSAASFAANVSNVDPSVAIWTGVIGGLVVPFAMLPVGLAFLMWDDRRKVDVGRTAVIASLIGTVIHLGFTYLAVYGAFQQIMKMAPGALPRLQAAQAQPAPDLNAPAPPLNLSGIPSLSPQR